MTNGEVVLRALQSFGEGLVTPRDVMWQVRRDGWQITTDKTRSVLRALESQGKARCVKEGPRYRFEAIR